MLNLWGGGGERVVLCVFSMVLSSIKVRLAVQIR